MMSTTHELYVKAESPTRRRSAEELGPARREAAGPKPKRARRDDAGRDAIDRIAVLGEN